MLSLGGCNRQETAQQSHERVTEALRELNEAAQIGVTPDEFDRARAYAVGAFEEARLKLRPIILREDLEMAVRFSARDGS